MLGKRSRADVVEKPMHECVIRIVKRFMQEIGILEALIARRPSRRLVDRLDTWALECVVFNFERLLRRRSVFEDRVHPGKRQSQPTL
jgi:hypothetical protein